MYTANAKRRSLDEAHRVFAELAEFVQCSQHDFWWFEFSTSSGELTMHRNELARMRKLFVHYLLDPDCRILAYPFDEPDETEEEECDPVISVKFH
jgi:hypothetical protein